MTSGWSPPDDRPAGRGVIEPELAAVGYPDEYRPVPTTPTTGVPATPRADDSTATAARHEAGEVADTAKEAGAQIVQSAKEQVGEVTKEAGRQARDLVDQIRSEASEQAATQQQRAAGGLHSLADELSGMANRSEQDGPATDLARQAADRLRDVARWLEHREPGDVVDEVRTFARRRPGAYLALAAGAGMLAGRLTRGLASHDDGTEQSSQARSGPTPEYGLTETSTAGWRPEREPAVAAPPDGIPSETPPLLGASGRAVDPGTIPPTTVTPGSVAATDQPISSSYTAPAPAAGRAGDIRR